MTLTTRRGFLSLAAALIPNAAIAHHGWGGYDTSKSFTITGKILKSSARIDPTSTTKPRMCRISTAG